MIRPLLLLATFCCLALSLGCPKKSVTTVAGTADERLDIYSSQLEELRSRANAGEIQCPDWCTNAQTVCEVSGQVCELAAGMADRPEATQRCATSQEDCARFNEECGRCK